MFQSQKRGQVTLFIAIGIILLVLAGVTLILVSRDIETPGLQIDISTQQSMSKYVESCLEQISSPLANQLISTGGTFKSISGRIYNEQLYPYICTQNSAHGCIPRMITRTTMESELDTAISAALDSCLTFSQFKEQGYSVASAPHTIKTTIQSEDIVIELAKEITLTKAANVLQESQFRLTLRSDLGKLHDLANKIMHDEIKDGFFDEDSWMTDHGENVEIHKHKPYPDTVYLLTHIDTETKNLQQMPFAIQGRDTSSFRGQANPPQQSIIGFCQLPRDSTCYPNINTETCSAKGGQWQQSSFDSEMCTGLTTFPGEECPNGNCNDCLTSEHSQSWCIYDGITGSGFDTTGSRHFKQTCIDGKIYTTECRDYREELCTEQGTQAECRINRWQDCPAQNDRSSCEDKSLRDCYWNDWLYKATDFRGPSGSFDSRRCIPVVPPGLRHWEKGGQKVCQVASEQYDCDGFKCPKVWVDSTAVYCYMQGDCGDYVNFLGAGSGATSLAEEGFESSSYNERPYVYDIPAKYGSATHLDLPLDTRAQKPLSSSAAEYYFPPSDASVMNQNLAEWQERIDPNSIFPNVFQMFWLLFQGKNPIKQGDTDTIHQSYCDVWTAPTSGPCDLCQSHPWKPCSEYRCKSISRSCSYTEINGKGICTSGALPSQPDISAVAFLMRKPLDTDVTIATLESKAERKLTLVQDINGFTISEPVPPFSVIAVAIFADQNLGSCTIRPTGAVVNPLTQPASEGQQTIALLLAVPRDASSEGSTSLLPSNLPNTNSSQILKLIADSNAAYAKANLSTNISLKDISKNPAFADLVKTLSAQGLVKPESSAFTVINASSNMQDTIGDSLTEVQKSQLTELLQISAGINKHTVICSPSSFDVTYRVSADIAGPTIVDISPAPGSTVSTTTTVQLVLDEPASCSFTSGALKGNFDCASYIYNTQNGLYVCETTALNPAVTKSATVSCTDNPQTDSSYTVTFATSANFTLLKDPVINGTILKTLGPKMVKVESGKLLLSELDLQKDATFGSPVSPVPVQLSFSEPTTCTSSIPLMCTGTTCSASFPLGKHYISCTPSVVQHTTTRLIQWS